MKDGVAGVKAALKVLRDYYDQKEAELLQKPNFEHKAEKGAGGSIISILEMVEASLGVELSTIDWATVRRQLDIKQVLLGAARRSLWKDYWHSVLIAINGIF